MCSLFTHLKGVVRSFSFVYMFEMIGRHLFSLFKSLGGLFFFVFIFERTGKIVSWYIIGSFPLFVPLLCSRNHTCWKPLDCFYSSAFSITWQLCAPSSGSFSSMFCFPFQRVFMGGASIVSENQLVRSIFHEFKHLVCLWPIWPPECSWWNDYDWKITKWH